MRLDRDYLRSLSDDQLGRELAQYVNYADTHEAGLAAISAEVERRGDADEVSRAYSAKAEAEEAQARQSSQFRENAARRRRQQADEHRDEVYRQWLHAEAATKGVMLNKAGKRAGIDERTLFTGPESRVAKYASPELIEYFESHPRPTRAAFLGSVRERREHLSGRRIG